MARTMTGAEMVDAGNLRATLVGATRALREAESDAKAVPSIVVGARLRYQEAVRCCEMAGVAVDQERPLPGNEAVS